MSYVVRLQNLPLSASAPDVRSFFSGFHIPNGGVRIIGGDDGQCFVVFTSSQDSRGALQKDGYWLNDQKIQLFNSSVEEMQYFTNLARDGQPSSNVTNGSIPNSYGDNTQPSNRFSSNNYIQNNFNPDYPSVSSKTNHGSYPSIRDGNSFPSSGFQNQPSGTANQFGQTAFFNQNIHKQDSLSSNQLDRLKGPRNFNSDTQSKHDNSEMGRGRQLHQDSWNRTRSNKNERPLNVGSFSEIQPASNMFQGRQHGAGYSGPQDPKLGDHMNSDQRNRWETPNRHKTMPQTDQDRGGQAPVASFPPRGMPQDRNNYDGYPKPHNKPGPGRVNSDWPNESMNFNNNQIPLGNKMGNFHTNPTQDSNHMPHNAVKGQSQEPFNSRRHPDVNSKSSFGNTTNNFMSEQRMARQVSPNQGNRDGLLGNRPPDVNSEKARNQPRQSGSAALLPTPDIPAVTPLLDLDMNIKPAQRNGSTFNQRSEMPNIDRVQAQSQGPNQPNLSSFNVNSSSFQPQSPLYPPNQPSRPIQVTDPCTVITQLAPDVTFKQLRGLFATHSVKALNIVIIWSEVRGEPSKAYVLFDDVNNTVLALNELKGMKVGGRLIDIHPCSMNEYNYQYEKNLASRSSNHARNDGPNNGQWHDTRSGPPPRSRDRSPERQPLQRGHSPPERNRIQSNNRASLRGSPPFTEEHDSSRRRRQSPQRSFGRGSRIDRCRSPRNDGSRYNRSRSPRRSSADRMYRRRSRSPRSSLDQRNRSGRGELRDRRSPIRTSRDSRRSSQDNHQSSNKEQNYNKQEIDHRSADQNTALKPQELSVSPQVWCVAITGLPPKTSQRDLEEFLKGVSYNNKNLYIEMNVHKECTGTAYVEVASESDQSYLISSQKEILNQSVHVSSINGKQMTEHVVQHKAQLASDTTKPGQFIIQLIGLPFEATPQVVKEFLYPANIKDSDVTIVKKPDGSGRCSGNAFAVVHSIEDRDESLKHDRGYIGKRYVCVKVVSKSFMDDFIAKQDLKKNESTVQLGRDPDISRTVNMVNLRYDLKPEQIEIFFKDFNPEPGSVKFIMNNGMPTGRGSIRLMSSENVDKAIKALCKKDLAGRSLLLNAASSF